MGWLSKSAPYFLGQMAYQYAFGKVKTKAILIYLKTLQAMRRSLAVGLIVFCILQFMVFGFLGIIVTAIWLLPEDTNAKLSILLGFFAVIFFVPFIALCYLLSERVWFRASGVKNLIEDV